jgi:hypothetical protein
MTGRHRALVPGQPLPLPQRIAAGEVLVRAWTPLVQDWWTVAVRAYWAYGHVWRAEGEFSLAALSGRAAVLNALGAAAALMFAHPLVQSRWPNELEVRNELEELLGEVFTGRRVRFGPRRALAPRGPLPGPRAQRRQHSDEWIAQREMQIRAYWRNHPPHREPNEIELTGEIPIHPRTYRRYLARKGEGGN